MMEPDLTRYLEALLAGDRPGARAALEAAIVTGGGGAARVSLVRAGQAELGRLWAAGRISVAVEHRATAIAQTLLREARSAAETPRGPRRVLVACVEGELHDLAAEIVALELEDRGCDVTFLGGNVAVWQLLERVHAIRPDVVVLSLTMQENIGSARRTVEALRADGEREVTVFVGGPNVKPADGPADIYLRGGVEELYERIGVARPA